MTAGNGRTEKVLDLSRSETRVETFPSPERVALDEPGRYRVEGRAGTAYFVRWRAKNHARTGFRGVLGEGPGTLTLRVD